MQMDKRNQIGCEDTTKLSKEGVRFDPKAACGKGSQPSVSLEAARAPAPTSLAVLQVPSLTVAQS